MDRGGRPAGVPERHADLPPQLALRLPVGQQDRRLLQDCGKFDVVPLPGIAGPGVSSLGGGNYAIAANAENKGTAADFIKFMAAAEQQKATTLATSDPPVVASLYSDADIVKKYPYFPTLLKSIETAKPRPKAVQYGDVTLAIQDAAYSSLPGGGTTAPDAALQQLQSKLQTLIQ